MSYRPKTKIKDSEAGKVSQGTAGGKRDSSKNSESEEAPLSKKQRTEPETLQKFLQRIGHLECLKILTDKKRGVTTVEELRRLLKNRSQAQAEAKLEGYDGISALAASDIWNGLQKAADGSITNNTTETPRKHGSGTSNTSQGDLWASASDIAAAKQVITGTNLWQPELTLEDLPLVGRESAFRQIDQFIDEIKSASGTKSSTTGGGPQRFTSFGKGQPILGTGATSGAGKSRLLQEFRQKKISAGAAVITLTYNSLENLGPAPVERCNDEDRVEKAFLSRLLCMMLPKVKMDKLGKSDLWKQYDVSRSEVAQLIAEKFAGKDVFILVDEVVNLSTKNQAGKYDDLALNKVVSVLGSLCHDVTKALDSTHCVGFFTALSNTIIEKAQTVSNRLVKVVALPLLSHEETSSLIDGWTTKMGKPKLSDTIKRELFAFTAGHARMLEAFLGSDYVKMWETRTLQGIIPAVKDLCSIDPPSSEDIIAMLAQRQEETERLDELCRRSLVQKMKSGGYLPVPALLYHWAASNDRGDLGKDLKAFFDASWNRIFLDDEKQGDNGKPLEKVLSSYERLRRHWLNGNSIPLQDFFRGVKFPTVCRWAKVNFFKITGDDHRLPQPSKNQWKNFNKSTLANTGLIYLPEKQNFPQYDWFSVVAVSLTDAANSKLVPIGSQSKHGKGGIPKADPDVISIKFSTKDKSLDDWREQGWLVLNGSAIREYLGPALSAAAVCVLLHPEGPAQMNAL